MSSEKINKIRSLNDTSDFPRDLRVVYDLELFDRGPHRVFKSGSLYHRLFLVLAYESKKPLSAEYLFAKMYPEEAARGQSSVQKVKMLLSRLRKLIQPLDIEIKDINNQGYRLCSSEPVGLLLAEEATVIEPDQLSIRIKKIEDVFGREYFKSQEVADLFNVSMRTASRWLNEMESKHCIQRYGERRGALYILKENIEKASEVQLSFAKANIC